MAENDDGSRQAVTVDRKSLADLWGSYGGKGYERERNKILKAKELGWKFILAIEGTAWEVRKGHEYWDGKQTRTAKKDGLSMIRMLMTVSRKYDVEVWFCKDRQDMAFRIEEYFLSQERIKPEVRKNTAPKSKKS